MRSAFVRGSLLLLVAACSSGSNNQVVGGTLGSTHDTSGLHAGGADPMADKALPFRKQFSNPGGMWLPEQMTLAAHVDNFKKMGVKLESKTLADPLAEPLAAVVQLPGCTGTLVSPEGLIVTNHHCVQGALQQNSTETENLVEHGFIARTKSEEKSAGPGVRMLVAEAFKDVTHEIRDGLDKIKDANARHDEYEKRTKAQVAACEKGRNGIKCSVSGFFRGAKYILTEALEIRDVRLVYAPSNTVGQYGGEIDNWAWPRHSADFAFYRAYVGRDGKAADYSVDNVPFVPKHYIRVTDRGVRPGDFVMVTGYPGHTARTATALETHHDVEWEYPYEIAYLKERYDMFESHLKDSGETAIKAAVAKQGVQNYLEKYQGILKGLTSGDLLKQKDELDKKVKEWAGKPGKEAYKEAIEKLEALLAEEHRTARADYDREYAFTGSGLMKSALSLTHWAEERAKSDVERKPGFQDRDMPRAIGSTKQLARTYDRTLDRGAFRLTLVRALQLPEADRTWLVTLLGAKKGTKVTEALIDKTLDAWYAAPQLEDQKVRLRFLQEGTLAQLKASKDPFVAAVQRIWPIVKADEKRDDARAADKLLVTWYYVDAMREVLGGMLSPDANSTLRITYGTVRAQKPNDASDSPLTVASQILTRDKGADPFDMPKNVLDAIKAKKYGGYADKTLGGELPVDFLTDLDITNGNSGSSTLNDRGELVGLVFDGTLEGVASDVVFDPATVRVIHVDARYMLWILDVIDNADHLIKEMGLQPKL